MIKEIQIENFRCFKDRTIFPLKNINLIYGDNNSGKTTFLRALALFKETFSQSSGLNLKIPSIPYEIGDNNSLHWVHDTSPYQEINFRLTYDYFPDWGTQHNYDGVEFVFDKSPENLHSCYCLKKLIFFKDSLEVFNLHTLEGNDQNFFHLLEPKISEEYLRTFINDYLRGKCDNISHSWTHNLDRNEMGCLADFFVHAFLIQQDNNDHYLLSFEEQIAFLQRIICFGEGEIDDLSQLNSIFLDSYTNSFEDGTKIMAPYCLKGHSSLDNQDYLNELKHHLSKVKKKLQRWATSRFRLRTDSLLIEGLAELISKTDYLNDTILNFRYFTKSVLKNYLSSFTSMTLVSNSQSQNKRFYSKDDSDFSHFYRLSEKSDLTRYYQSKSFGGMIPTSHNLNRELKKFQLRIDEVVCETQFDEEVCRIIVKDLFGIKYNLHDLGYGVYQLIKFLIPFCSHSFELGPTTPLVAIEEPEVHLHPQAQIKFFNSIVDLSIQDDESQNKQIILDTHMEVAAYTLLDRISKTTNNDLQTGETALYDHNVQFLKVEFVEDDKCAIVHPIAAGKYGTFSPPWPGGFFDLNI